ncbi:ATP-binding protein [Verrucomicrobium sp. BvORR034]|uniref:two-component system sensor histidine kinase NtrB n=1 Tax=Verrucomicrobium sp. BvORR034 TaxID=1396418 RepID=UPI000678C969|nr:ATP-binding protein [Verrucomicrobium sp. BvORR034]
MKSSFFDKIVKRMDRLEPADVQRYLLRLVQEKGFFEKVFEALQEGVILLDGEGVVTYVNRAACGFFGFDREVIVGRSLAEGIRGFDWELLAKSGGSVSRDLEVFYPENRYLNFYVTAIDEHEDLGFVMLIRDITQTRKLTEEKIESERISALTMLAAGVAHELGNPLNSLTIHLQLLDRRLRKLKAAEAARLREMVEVAQGEIKRLDFIIGQFLAAIRPTHPQLQRVQLNELIEEAVKFLAPELKQHKVDVRLDLTRSLPLMPLDANQMKQAFYNLIRNSTQAMGEGGRLTIISTFTDYEVRLTFADTGKGISGENLSNLFQPFFTTRKTGTGLGLLIVRRIVREHGGEIELESREGEGTKVNIYLPRVEKQMRFLEAPAPPVVEVDVGEDPAREGKKGHQDQG